MSFLRSTMYYFGLRIRSLFSPNIHLASKQSAQKTIAHKVAEGGVVLIDIGGAWYFLGDYAQNLFNEFIAETLPSAKLEDYIFIESAKETAKRIEVSLASGELVSDQKKEQLISERLAGLVAIRAHDHHAYVEPLGHQCLSQLFKVLEHTVAQPVLVLVTLGDQKTLTFKQGLRIRSVLKIPALLHPRKVQGRHPFAVIGLSLNEAKVYQSSSLGYELIQALIPELTVERGTVSKITNINTGLGPKSVRKQILNQLNRNNFEINSNRMGQF